MDTWYKLLLRLGFLENGYLEITASINSLYLEIKYFTVFRRGVVFDKELIVNSINLF